MTAAAAAGHSPRRVLVLGNCGSGKSTLARQLGPALGLDVVHLDALYWRPGWVGPTDAEWADAVAAATARDAWVMDGNYSGTIAPRLARADAVVLLDLPRALCLWRVLARRVRYHGRPRPDMAGGCPERVTWAFLKWVWTYPTRSRAAMLGRLQGAAGRTPTWVLRSPRQVRRFVGAVRQYQATGGPIDYPTLGAAVGPAVQRRRAALPLVTAAVLIGSVVAHYHAGDDWARYDHRTFTVAAVIDGVTLRLDDGTPVRLLGVTDPTPAAAAWLAGRCRGRRVTLLLPTAGVRDAAGDLVGYAYPADDGGSCLSVDLAHDGLAYADRRTRDPLAGLIDPAENDARRKGRGLWASLRFDQMPPWRQAWVRSRQIGSK